MHCCEGTGQTSKSHSRMDGFFSVIITSTHWFLVSGDHGTYKLLSHSDITVCVHRLNVQTTNIQWSLWVLLWELPSSLPFGFWWETQRLDVLSFFYGFIVGREKVRDNEILKACCVSDVDKELVILIGLSKQGKDQQLFFTWDGYRVRIKSSYLVYSDSYGTYMEAITPTPSMPFSVCPHRTILI